MDLFNLRAVIGLDTSEYERGIKSSSGLFTKVGRGFKTTAKAIGKTVAVGVGAGAAAFAALAKASLDARGELEQNLGGSKQVFQKYADDIQDIGDLAYKKLGLSQSDYLATANKMGALLQGSGFSIAESFDLTTEVMQRAADVASIMGLDTSAAMEAIAGAAKGNFTMMDNLGVAINDTALAQYALAQGISKSTQEMSTQEKVGLAMDLFLEKTAYAAGNYARENETLAGSLGTAKAAFDNFLSGAGTAEQVVESVLSAAKVVAANLVTILPDLALGVSTLMTGLIPMLPDLIAELLPAVISGAALLISGLIANAPALAKAILQGIYDGIMIALPILADAGASMLSTILTALTGDEVTKQEVIDYFSELWGSVTATADVLIAALDRLLPLIVGITAAIVTFKAAIAIPEAITNLIALIGSGTSKLSALWAVAKAHPVAAVIAAIVGLAAAFTTLWQKCEGFREFWSGLFTYIGDSAESAWETVSTGASMLYTSLKGWFKKTFLEGDTITARLFGVVSTGWDNMSTVVEGGAKSIWQSVKDWFTQTVLDGGTLMESLSFDTDSIFSKLGNWVINSAKGIWEGVTGWFSDTKEDVKTVFWNLWFSAVQIWGYIKSAITNPIEDAKEVIGGIVEDIVDSFDVEISWPDIPLPHFSISPKGWKIGDLLEGSLPSLSIAWHNRAMHNPMLLRGATIFGMQDGRMLGGGDAGGEIVAGANTVVQMITDAVHSALSSGNLGGVVVNQNIYSEAKTAADLMQEARWEAERAVLTSV